MEEKTKNVDLEVIVYNYDPFDPSLWSGANPWHLEAT